MISRTARLKYPWVRAGDDVILSVDSRQGAGSFLRIDASTSDPTTTLLRDTQLGQELHWNTNVDQVGLIRDGECLGIRRLNCEPGSESRRFKLIAQDADAQ